MTDRDRLFGLAVVSPVHQKPRYEPISPRMHARMDGKEKPSRAAAICDGYSTISPVRGSTRSIAFETLATPRRDAAASFSRVDGL